MWHEARKQERKIRGMIVDYRKRAERRQDFYEKIKADPTQFMQIHGRGCKIHLDPAVAAAGDGAAIIVPWQGQKDNLIDRFDVRAHLDYIPPPPKVNELEDISPEERHCNYERYRILAQNDFLGTSEEKFLHQLHLDEQFGANAHLEMDKMGSKKKSAAGAAISYSYDTSNDVTPFSHPIPVPGQAADAEAESDSDLDMDVSIDVGKLDTSQAHELNACGRNYGMMSNDFYSFLTKDADEADALKMAREEEQEKIMLSGRKSRRERRAQREKRFSGRPMSPPSYAAKEDVSNINCSMNDNESDSRSPSPENSGKITFITSFGGEDELRPHSKISINLNKRGTVKTPSGLQNQVTYADKLKENLSQFDSFNEIAKKSSPPRKPMQYMRNASSSRSRSRSRSYRHRSRKRSPADRYSSRRPTYNSRRRGYSRNRSRSRSRSRTRSRSRSPKYSRNRRSSTSSSSSNSSPQRQTAANCRREVLTKPKDSISNIQASSSNLQKSPIMPTVICPVPEPSQPTVQVPTCEPAVVAETTEVPIKRYYGRKRDGNSSSSEELTDYEGNSGEENSNGDKSSQPSSKVHSTGSSGQTGKNVPTATTSYPSSSQLKGSMAGEKQNLRDRLKRKMQILLNKQYKADKKAEIERTERQMQQQQEREDEMRELALKLRKRQREIRHKYGTPNSESSDSSQSDGSEAKNNGNAARHSSRQPQAKSRSKSRDRESRDRKIPRSSSNRNPSPSRSYSSNRSRRSRSGSRHLNNKDYAGDRRYERNYRRQDDNDRHRSPRRYAPPSRDRRERESSNYEGGRRDRRDSKSRDRDRTSDRRAYSPKRRLVDY